MAKPKTNVRKKSTGKKSKTLKTVRSASKKKIKPKPVKKKEPMKVERAPKPVEEIKAPEKKPKPGFLKKLFNRIKKKEEENNNEKQMEISEVKRIRTVLIEEIMVRNPITMDSKDTIANAFELIHKYQVPGIVVLEKNKVLGIVSEKEILDTFSCWINIENGSLDKNKEQIESLSGKPVSMIMVRISEFVGLKTPIEDAIKIMQVNRLKILPVVEKGNLKGVVLRSIILDYISNLIEEEGTVGEDIIETGIDRLYEMIVRRGEITVDEAGKRLEMPPAEIEKWARILQNHGLILIDFSKMGSIRLVKK